MSLINDYLKKSRAAKEEKSSASAGVPPVMKPPQREGGAPPKEKKVSSKTVVLLVIMILMGGAAYYFTMLPTPSAPKPYSEPAKAVSRSPLEDRVREKNNTVLNEGVPALAESQKQVAESSGQKDRAEFVPHSTDRDSKQEKSQPAVAKKELVQPNPKAVSLISQNLEANSAPVAAAVVPETGFKVTEPETSASDTATVTISSIPVSGGAVGNKITTPTAARVRRPSQKDDIDHLFQVGVLALSSGNRSRAHYYFNRILELDPEHQETLLNMAVICLERNDFKKALKLLSKADPRDARVKVNQGLIALKSDNHEKAQKLFADALLLDAGSSSALNNLAWLAQQRGDQAAAARHYRNLVALDPQNLKALLAYASLCEQLKEFNQALSLYQEALKSRFLENDRPLERRIRARIKLLTGYME